MEAKKALIVGATGLVGNELLHILLEAKEYETVTAIVRRPLSIKHPKLNEVIIDFDHLEQYSEQMVADDVFCCLGTTIKKAKTKEVMKKIDADYPLALAKLTQRLGAKHFLLISSMNANPSSKIWYSQMKGKLEEELSTVPFQTISIVRPSLLLGNRREFRLGEKIAATIFQAVSFVFVGPLLKVKAIEARQVAQSMYSIAQNNRQGVNIYPSDILQREITT
ncbi:NAD(P)H-binding protein [Bacillus coreaensis]